MYFRARSVDVVRSVPSWQHTRPLFAQHVLTRQASTSSHHPFPFPPCTHPTPYEIFHLPRGASQDEIKARYYELVKVYHPDSSHFRHDASPSVRNARFRAVTHAYGVLRGRNGLSSMGSAGPRDYHEFRDEAIRAELRRRSRRSRSASSSSTTAADSARHEDVDGGQHWYKLMAFVLFGLVTAMGSVSSHMDRVERHTQSAAANLAQARADAQVYGMERRRKIRELVRSFHGARETVDESGHPEMHDASKAWRGGLLRGETESEDVLDNKRT